MTTVAPTTAAPTTISPTTLSTTVAPATTTPRDPTLDMIFNCKANNYAGYLFVETYIEGVIQSPSYGLADLELYVETYITGKAPLAGLYRLADLELSIETYIDGSGVANDSKKNWIGWSKIGEANFTIDKVNDAGFKAMEWSGYVYNVLRLGKNVIIYGSGGVSLAFPVVEPMPTYGFKELIKVGIKNKTAVCGDEFVHFCIDVTGVLWRISAEGIERLGYEEYLLPLTNPVLIWDAAERKLYISDDSVGYILNEGALTGGYGRLTGLYRIKEDLTAVGPGDVIAEAVEIVTDIFDFKRRGMKSIESIQFDVGAEIDVYAAIDYRFKKDRDFDTTQWAILNDSGVAHLKASGVEFRLRIKGIKYGKFDLSYAKIQYKLIDQRFSRDANNRRSELNDY